MKVLLALALLIYAVPCAAQTHPCDIGVVQNPNLTSPVKAAFCHSGKESDGTTAIVAWKVLLDAAPTPVFLGPLVAIGVANATGFFYFETPTFQVSKGAHVAVVVGTGANGSEVTTRSVPIPFDVINPLAAAPVAGRIIK